MRSQAYHADEAPPLTEKELAASMAENIMLISFTNAEGDAVYPVEAKVDEKEKCVVNVDLSDGSSFNLALSCAI